MKCPDCDGDVPAGARFCAFCGLAVRVCPTCPTVWPAAASFCGACGTSLLVELPRRELATQRLVSSGDTAEIDESIAIAFVDDGQDNQSGFLYTPRFPEQRHRLSEGELTIGAGDKNDIIIERPAVSWNHALVIVRNTAVKIQDSASTNGTFVNDVRVVRPRAIKHGDVLRFGNVELKVWLKPSMRY